MWDICNWRRKTFISVKNFGRFIFIYFEYLLFILWRYWHIWKYLPSTSRIFNELRTDVRVWGCGHCLIVVAAPALAYKTLQAWSLAVWLRCELNCCRKGNTFSTKSTRTGLDGVELQTVFMMIRMMMVMVTVLNHILTQSNRVHRLPPSIFISSLVTLSFYNLLSYSTFSCEILALWLFTQSWYSLRMFRYHLHRFFVIWKLYYYLLNNNSIQLFRIMLLTQQPSGH
jgi:hypothetical protein